MIADNHNDLAMIDARKYINLQFGQIKTGFAEGHCHLQYVLQHNLKGYLPRLESVNKMKMAFGGKQL